MTPEGEALVNQQFEDDDVCRIFKKNNGLFFRSGLSLLEEKTTRKMSGHSFSNLSAAQVGALSVHVLVHI